MSGTTEKHHCPTCRQLLDCKVIVSSTVPAVRIPVHMTKKRKGVRCANSWHKLYLSVAPAGALAHY